MNPANHEQEQIEDVAARWVVRHDAGLAPGEQKDFESWLAADARHFAAFTEMQTALGALDRPRALGRESQVMAALSPSGAKHGNWRRSVVWLATSAAAAVLLFLAWPPLSYFQTPPAPSLATVIPAPERRMLPDGSIVELNAHSEIAVDYTEKHREVRLLRGEALFEVAKNAARPFVVSVGSVEVRAVGTAFVVRRDSANVDVLVTEGRVAVASSITTDPTPAGSVFVSAGARVAVPVNGDFTETPRVEAVSPQDLTAALAWRGMRFEFTNTSLAEAIELFNGKSRVQLALADSSLSDLRVSGIYWADDPQGLARLLESSFDITAVDAGPGKIVLHRRR